MNHTKIYNMYKNLIVSPAVEPFPRMHVFKLDRYINNDYMYFVMAIEISALAFVIFYTAKEVKKIKEQGKKYFKVDYFFIICSWREECDR